MTPPSTNWLPGIIVALAGAALALGYLFFSRRLRNEAPAPETTDDFDARYQALLEQTRAHLANRHLLPAEEFEREKTRLEHAAADVLRSKKAFVADATRREARAEALAKAEASKPAASIARKALAWAGVLGAFFGVLGWQLQKQATVVEAPAQQPGPMAGAPPSRDDKLEGLVSRLRQDPDDVEAVRELALFLLRRQNFEEGLPLVDRSMLLDPFNPRARVGHAVGVAVRGDLLGAMTLLEALAAKYPEAYDGYMFAGLMALEDRDEARGLKNLKAYVTMAPPGEQPPFIRRQVMELEKSAP